MIYWGGKFHCDWSVNNELPNRKMFPSKYSRSHPSVLHSVKIISNAKWRDTCFSEVPSNRSERKPEPSTSSKKRRLYDWNVKIPTKRGNEILFIVGWHKSCVNCKSFMVFPLCLYGWAFQEGRRSEELY